MRHNRAMREPSIRYCYFDSPVGPILLAGGDDSLRYASFARGSRPRQPAPDWEQDEAALGEARRQLQGYFAGELTQFELPLQPTGNAFQMAVWSELLKIPYGETASYGEIATRIGQPLSASRAVGAANGANPLPIFIPCHRVIGADHSLTGFGGGLETKRFLLELEFRVRPPKDTLFAHM